MKKFIVGKTYATASLCDSECIYLITVTKRTAQTVWFIYFNEEKSRRIFADYNGNEAIRPFGSYSMAPIINASKVVEDKIAA